MKCVNCYEELREGAEYCSSCGVSQEPLWRDKTRGQRIFLFKDPGVASKAVMVMKNAARSVGDEMPEIVVETENGRGTAVSFPEMSQEERFRNIVSTRFMGMWIECDAI